MSVATMITPADVARRVKPLQVKKASHRKASTPEQIEATKMATAERWAKRDKLRRSLEGRLQGCDRRYAGQLRKQLAEVKRLLRQDAWAAPKKS